MYCSNCGKEFEGFGDYCPACAKKYGVEYNSSSSASHVGVGIDGYSGDPRGTGRDKRAAAWLILIGVLILIYGAFCLRACFVELDASYIRESQTTDDPAVIFNILYSSFGLDASGPWMATITILLRSLYVAAGLVMLGAGVASAINGGGLKAAKWARRITFWVFFALLITLIDNIFLEINGSYYDYIYTVSLVRTLIDTGIGFVVFILAAIAAGRKKSAARNNQKQTQSTVKYY